MAGTAKPGIIPTAPPYYPPPPPAEQPYPHQHHYQPPAEQPYPHQHHYQPPAIGQPVQAQHQHHHASAFTYYPVNQLPPLPPPVNLGPQYSFGHDVDLVIVRKFRPLTNDFVVRDVHKNVLFEAKGKLLTFHDVRLLSDTNTDHPVITLRRQKIFTARSSWKVYKRDSWEAGDLLFTVKTSSSMVDQSQTRLNVYLANNTFQDDCDYWVKGSLTKDSCTIYVGNSQTNIAARMKKKSRFLGKDKFTVRVSANVNYASMVGIILIFDAIKN